MQFNVRMMNVSLLLVLCVFSSNAAANVDVTNTSAEQIITSFEDNTDALIPNCTQTDSSEHQKCLELHENRTPNATRTVNQTVADVCVPLHTECVANCHRNVTCENDCPVCPLNASELPINLATNQTLSSNCRGCLTDCSTTECRIKCFQHCGSSTSKHHELPIGTHTIIVHQSNGSDATSEHRIVNALHPGDRNMTTIIRLANVINNANHIVAPVNITSVGQPQSSADATKTGGEFGFGRTADGACCLAIRPKSCRMSSNGMRCHHRRHRTCGPQCTSHTIHVHLKQNDIAYVAQPKPPNCIYIDRWPFVSCTVAFERQLITQNCQGCYDHYGVGFQRYHQEDAEHFRIRCRGCYDDAFEHGPLYRRGPVLRPFHYHQQPCAISQRCVGTVECGHYGCYGDELVDPISGQRPPSTTSAAPVSTSIAGDQDHTPSIVDDKCKIVSNDTTVVRNCTEANINTNPYAAVPATAQQSRDIDENTTTEDYEEADYADADTASDEETEELNRVARSHATRKHNLIVGDFDDTHDGRKPLPVQRKRYQYARKDGRRRRKYSPRNIRIVYDDISENDYE